MITDEDRKIWQEFIKNITKLDKPSLSSIRSYQKRFLYPNVAFRLDLHGYTINKAYDALITFLDKNKNLGRKKVSIITGRGKPDKNETLNKLVPRWLKEKPMCDLVRSYHFLDKNPGELEVILSK